jgi:hypothetical protein
MDSTTTDYTSADGRRVSKAGAIFGFISDFGGTDIKQEMTYSQAIEMVLKERDRVWGGLGERVAHMIQFNIPFVPFTSEEKQQLIVLEFKEQFGIEKVVVPPHIVKYISEQANKYARNGRGIYDFIKTQVDSSLRGHDELYVDFNSETRRLTYKTKQNQKFQQL